MIIDFTIACFSALILALQVWQNNQLIRELKEANREDIRYERIEMKPLCLRTSQL